MISLPGDVLANIGEPKIDDATKQSWNDYVQYLQTKGLKGHPSLDQGDTALNVLDAYRKENPKTLLTRENIPLIQQEFSTYRGKALADIKSGKATGPVNPDENFMPGLSKIDGIPGSMTTSYSFPAARNTHQVHDEKGKVIASKTDVQPFARN